jgi:hypothetical protein
MGVSDVKGGLSALTSNLYTAICYSISFHILYFHVSCSLDHAVDSYEYVRVDAFVTERFTSTPSIVDIYQFCGLSMLTEYFPYGDAEKDIVGFPHRREDFDPLKDTILTTLNNFTAREKLQVALGMVEPVIALHNFKDGVIVHDDIQLCQYLWTEEKGLGLKLNDFNRAEIMLVRIDIVLTQCRNKVVSS